MKKKIECKCQKKGVEIGSKGFRIESEFLPPLPSPLTNFELLIFAPIISHVSKINSTKFDLDQKEISFFAPSRHFE